MPGFSTKIEWKAGKNLTQRIMKKKPKKGSKDTKIITKTEDVLSFFSFFSPPEVPEGDDEDDVVSLSPLSPSLDCCKRIV